jgi:hypothetical protein
LGLLCTNGRKEYTAQPVQFGTGIALLKSSASASASFIASLLCEVAA